MRKPYSPEIENQVLSKYFSGESVRAISESVGVSMGYVSNCIENFTSKIEKGEINALHDFYKIIRKNGMQAKDAFLGYALFSAISKYKLDITKIHPFIESVLLFAQNNNLSAEQLSEICGKFSDIQSTSNIPLDELNNYCNDLLTQKKQLGETVSQLELKHKQLKNNISSMLEKNNLVEKQVEMTVQVLASLKKLGLDVSDLNSFTHAVQNAKAKKYDVAELVSYLNQDKSLEISLQEKQSQLDAIETKMRIFTKKHDNLSLRHENLTLRHNSMLDAIKSVEHLGENGVLVDFLPVWQRIFDSFGMPLTEFEKELKNIGGYKKICSNLDSKKSKLTKDVARLEKKISWLEDNANNLASNISNGVEFGKNNLEKITTHAESQINHTVIHTKKSLDEFMKQNQSQLNFSQKQFMAYFMELTAKLEELLEHSHKAEHSLAKMESLKPLHDLIAGKFDPVTSIPQIIVILDKLHVGIKNTPLDKQMLSFDIKRVREHLLNLISHA